MAARFDRLVSNLETDMITPPNERTSVQRRAGFIFEPPEEEEGLHFKLENQSVNRHNEPPGFEFFHKF